MFLFFFCFNCFFLGCFRFVVVFFFVVVVVFGVFYCFCLYLWFGGFVFFFFIEYFSEFFGGKFIVFVVWVGDCGGLCIILFCRVVIFLDKFVDSGIVFLVSINLWIYVLGFWIWDELCDGFEVVGMLFVGWMIWGEFGFFVNFKGGWIGLWSGFFFFRE